MPRARSPNARIIRPNISVPRIGAPSPARTTNVTIPCPSKVPMIPRSSGKSSLKSAMRMVLHPARGRRLLLRVAAGEDAGHEAEHVRRAHLAVPVVPHQPALHHVDLLLRRLVHHVGHQARQLNGILLV